MISLPLLKSYLPDEWNVTVVDINAKLFSFVFGYDILLHLKQDFLDAIEKMDLQESVKTCLELEGYISSKTIGSAILHGRSLRIIDKWYDSNAVFDYLQEEHVLSNVISSIIDSCIRNDNIDVFGISVSIEEQVLPCFIICSIIKKNYPKSKIILGGNIVTRLYDNLLKSSLSHYFDLLIIGEGEDQIQQAIETVLSGDSNHGKLYHRKNKISPVIFQNLKTPDYSDISWDDYLSPVRVMPITAQRKCKWSKCDFCSIHTCWESGSRDRDVNDVVNEISFLVQEYNISYFRFVDEMVSESFLYKLSSLLIRENLKIYYEAYVRFENGFAISDRIKTIYEGGCRQLFWGLENINDDALLFMNKGTTKDLIDRCLKTTGEIGITNYCFILLGIPQIPYPTEIETMLYACRNRNIHVGVVGSFVIDRNSPIHLKPMLHKKYDITLFDVGDLTTEVGYKHGDTDIRKENKTRVAEMIKGLYKQRLDYALCSLISEENRLVLSTVFGNAFAQKYVCSLSPGERHELLQRSTAHLIDERVTRRVEE